MRALILALALLVLGGGCSAARRVGPGAWVPDDPRAPRTVVLEPFFETAEWQVSTRTETAQVYGAMGQTRQVAVQRQVAEKPVVARVDALVTEHQRVIRELQRLRPSWRVTSTGGLPALSGPATLVRVVVSQMELANSNRSLKNLAFGVGLLLWPLLVYAAQPVHETQRVHGRLWRYDAPAEQLVPRLLKYPTQPDFAADTRGLAPLNRRFDVPIEYEEGLLADENLRGPVLMDGFAERLAAAVVAIVEEQR